MEEAFDSTGTLVPYWPTKKFSLNLDYHLLCPFEDSPWAPLPGELTPPVKYRFQYYERVPRVTISAPLSGLEVIDFTVPIEGMVCEPADFAPGINLGRTTAWRDFMFFSPVVKIGVTPCELILLESPREFGPMMAGMGATVALNVGTAVVNLVAKTIPVKSDNIICMTQVVPSKGVYVMMTGDGLKVDLFESLQTWWNAYVWTCTNKAYGKKAIKVMSRKNAPMRPFTVLEVFFGFFLKNIMNSHGHIPIAPYAAITNHWISSICVKLDLFLSFVGQEYLSLDFEESN